MDNYLWKKIQKHLKGLHPNKSRKWINKRYFRKAKHGGNDRWILTCPKTGIQIVKFSWTKIVRHALIKFKNSPDDPTLKEYWENRDRKEFNHNNTMSRIKLAKQQHYKCPICNMNLQNGEPLVVHLKIPKTQGGSEEYKNLQLIHTTCS